jgi:hypothetical protein
LVPKHKIFHVYTILIRFFSFWKENNRFGSIILSNNENHDVPLPLSLAYYQLSFTKNGRSSTKFVNSKCLRKVKMQVKNYSRLRKLVEKWLELGTELSDLRISDKLK